MGDQRAESDRPRQTFAEQFEEGLRRTTNPEHSRRKDRPRCCACGDRIERGFEVRDDEGNVYCEGCWSP